MLAIVHMSFFTLPLLPTGELKEETTYEVREGIVRQVSIYTSKIWRGITRLDGVCYSVRCVKDAN